MKKLYVVASISLAVCSLAGILLADYFRSSPDTLTARYIGRDSCVDCHQTEANLFAGSDHDLAMDLATVDTVLGDFDDQSLEHYGITSRMFRDGDRFMVHTDGPDGEMHDYEVKYVFGVRPLQQYMVELKRPEDAKANEVGQVQVLRISWDTNRKQWFYLMPPDVDEKLSPSDPLHWTGITQNWNASCASCHSTDVHKNYNALTGNYHTTFSEIDVSCEACHGPGEYHVELANRASLFWDRKHGYGLAQLKVDDNVPQVETCAPCHSRRTAMSESFQPGCNFDDYFATQLITDPIYHVDGQVRDEDYVYGSFIQSKMYHNGIKCSDCHDPHSAKVKFTDNRLCTSCHQHPSGKYDTPNHHHHAPGTPGSMCVDCHMPATTYMMVDSRRDHSFRVPRPDMSLQFGTPNACTACHIDPEKLTDRESEAPLKQYLDWIIAAENGDRVVAKELKRVNEQMNLAVESWYPPGEAADKTRYYQQLAEGLHGSGKEAAVTLAQLATDRSVPAMIRASAIADLATDPGEESLDAAIASLADPSAKVVSAALLRIDFEIGQIADRSRYQSNPSELVRSLRPIAEQIAPLFDHPSRRVRTEAARVFSGFTVEIQNQATSSRERKNYQAALDELEQSLLVENDRASTHMMLGGLHEMTGDYDQAKSDYRTAIDTEPNVAGPRSNLAALLENEVQMMQNQLRSMQSGQGGGVQAGQLKALLERMQQLQIKVAQLRAEEHLLLAEDIKRSENLPDTHGLHYRFAMSSYLQQDLEATELHLLKAHNQQPNNATYLLGLATYYQQVGQPQQALQYAEKLLEISPDHPGYQSLEDSIRAAIGR